MDYSPLGSSVHRILQARILEWVAALYNAKSWLIEKDPYAGKDWGQEEKGTAEDKMVGWHHQLNVYGFGWTLAVGDGQGGLVCCSSWGRKESDMTELLNWTELNWKSKSLLPLWPPHPCLSSLPTTDCPQWPCSPSFTWLLPCHLGLPLPATSTPPWMYPSSIGHSGLPSCSSTASITPMAPFSGPIPGPQSAPGEGPLTE